MRTFGFLAATMMVRSKAGEPISLASDAAWKCSNQQQADWQQPGFGDQKWQAAHVVGNFGGGPWGKLVASGDPAESVGTPTGNVHRAALAVLARPTRRAAGSVVPMTPPADFVWPAAIVFVDEDCSLYRETSHGPGTASLKVTVFNPRRSRAFPEHDLPAPMKVGRKLMMLKPARPGVQPQLLLDAGRGAVGSPSVSFDGQSILVSMAREGDPFFHLYRLSPDGGEPQQLTRGPFHDIGPAELPDGRIVFTSTRIGTFEEYHAPPSRALFVTQRTKGSSTELAK